MLVRQAPLGLQVKLTSGPRICYQRPAVDVLFQSVAQIPRIRTIGVILTGMGNDGAGGLKRMRDAGACTIAQDQSTSVVYGMPREAVRLGAAMQVLPLPCIAHAISDWCSALARPSGA
jgi:two-component system chemotaxis response regulator CheB